jgi:hypothetical protein
MSTTWTLDLFRPTDAAGVVALYRDIYGENYHVASVYDPELLIAEQEQGDVYRAVARSACGEVVGHTAYARSSPPNRGLYEACQLVVHHDWRGSALASELTLFAIEQIPLQYQIRYTWGEAVTNHLFSQRIYTGSGHAETGIELDLLPGGSMAQAMRGENRGRISVVTIFRNYGPPQPQTIYLPSSYTRQLPFLYSGFEHGHCFVDSTAPLATDRAVRGKLDIFAAVAVARITFLQLGGDFAACLADYETQTAAVDVRVHQVFLPLTDPAIGEAVNCLRKRGYFLGAVLPCWYGDDGLLMQKLIDEPNLAGTKLFTDRARDILSVVLSDRNSVAR